MLFSKKGSMVLAFVLLLTMVFSLSACAGSKGGDVLRIGVDDVYPPMEFRNEKNETVGFDIELAQAIGAKLGKKVEFISNEWSGIFQALETNKFDCIFSSVSITEARLEKYALTKPYIANAQIIVVRPDNDAIKEAKDLAGKKVGVQIGTTADESCEKYIKEQGISFELKKYDQIIQPFSDMIAGRLEAIVVDEVVGAYYVNQDKANFKISSARLTNEPIGVCFTKQNAALRDQFDKAIDELRADGTLKKISEKWFGVDLTSNIDEKLW